MSNNQIDDGRLPATISQQNSELGSNHTYATTPTRTRVSARPTDIVCGRGFHIVNHRGNLNLHLMVNTYREEYMTSRRADKRRITKLVLHELKSSGTRFIRRVASNGQAADEWEEVDDETALKKVSHALRLRTKNESNREDGPMGAARAAHRQAGVPIDDSDQPEPRESILSAASDPEVVHGDSNRASSPSQQRTPPTETSAPSIGTQGESQTETLSSPLSNEQSAGPVGVPSQLLPFVYSLSSEQRLQYEANHQAYWNMMLALLKQSQR